MVQGLRAVRASWLVWFALMWMIPLCGAEETATENTVVVIGTAVIKDKNVAAAKSEALENGLLSAVDQVAVGHSGPEAMSRVFSDYNGWAVKKADDYVDQYQILAESSADGRYRMLLSVTVSGEKLLGRLPAAAVADATQASGVPRVLFLVAEQGMTDPAPRFWWGEGEQKGTGMAEAAMMAVGTRAGFEVVDHGDKTPDIPVKGAIVFQADISDRDALEVGRYLNAGLVVVGKAIVYKVTDTAGEQMPMYNATLTARILHTGTGESLASILETGVAQHWDDTEGGHQALKNAGTQAMERLLSAIKGELSPSGEKTDIYTIYVTGTENLGHFVQFRKQLSQTPRVDTLRMTELKPNTATLQVSFAGERQALTNALKSMAFELFTVEIETEEDRTVRLALKDRP